MVIIIIFALIIFCGFYLIYDQLYSPIPPDDQFVVALSPFYYIDESGNIGSDINTRDDFKEMLEKKSGLGIKIVLLDDPIRNLKDAKDEGESVGAHLIVYGESKSKIGNIGEIQYNILPLAGLEILPIETSSFNVEIDESTRFITEKVTFSMATEEPIQIIESLKENTSSAIFIIVAFENYKRSKFDFAIDYFSLIENYENDSIVLFYIGNCYSHLNDFGSSLQYYEKSTAINQNFSTAWINSGIALAKQERYEESLDAYDKAIGINPRYELAWDNKATAFFNLGRYEESLLALNKTIDINPQSYNAWNNKAVVLIEFRMYEEALNVSNKAIKIDSEYGPAWNNEAFILYRLGRHAESLIIYDKILDINSQDAVAWIYKGLILSNFKKDDEALNAYNKAIDINPKIAEAWNYKGVSLSELGYYDLALESFDEAIYINQNYSEAWYNKGLTLYNLDRYTGALDAYDKATDINPEFTEAWGNKAATLDKLGRDEEAIAAFDKAHEND